VTTERVRRAVAYLEEGSADLTPLNEMGLTATDLDEVLGLVAWGDRASLDVKDALEQLYEARAAEEEKAGLATPLVVVKEEREAWSKRLFIVLVAIGALVLAVMAWRTRQP